MSLKAFFKALRIFVHSLHMRGKATMPLIDSSNQPAGSVQGGLENLIAQLDDRLAEQDPGEAECLRIPRLRSQRKNALLKDAEYEAALRLLEQEQPELVRRLRQDLSRKAPELLAKVLHICSLLLRSRKTGNSIALRALAKEVYYKGFDREVTPFMTSVYDEATAVILKDIADLGGCFSLGQGQGEPVIFPASQ